MSNTHDILLKERLQVKENAIDFLKAAVPKDILACLDLNSIISTDHTFITNDLKSLAADVVYDCKLATGEEVYCTILIEHKSYDDPHVGFQIGSYIFGAYRKNIKNKEDVKLIIPILFCHHGEKYAYRPIASFFDHYPAILRIFIPIVDPMIFLVQDMSDESIMSIRNIAINTMFISQKHRNQPAYLFEKLSNILESLQTKEERNSFETIIVYVLTVFDKEIGIIEILRENINKPINKLFMTLYDKIELKGEIKGKIEGELKAHRQTVLNGFKNGLEIKMISNITQLAEEEVIKILKEEGLMK